MTENDRKHERASVQVKVKLMHPDIPSVTLEIRDMSFGGLFLLTDSPNFLPVGSQVQVQLISEDVTTPVTNMKIVRCTEDGVGLCYC